MLTTYRHLRTVTCMLLLAVAVPVYGQTSVETTDPEVESVSNETTLDATSTATGTPTAEERWFETDTISGRVDVGDFVVGPGRSEIELAPGETYVQEITVTNRISDNREFKLEVEDVVGSTDGSAAVQLVEEGIGPRSILEFISFPEDTFSLKLGERARIPVTITIPPNAEPGGYYGSVLVSTVRTADTEGTAAPRSPLIARVGSLFFVTVEGEVVREGATKAISTVGDKKWYQAGPIDLAILFENTGTVHLNPYGEISITNMFGEEVGFEQLEPWFVLPDSLRSREVSWDREFLLGRYVVTAKINRGYDNVIDEVTTTFWVLPWKILVGTFVALFVLIFTVRFFFRNFEFKRKA